MSSNKSSNLVSYVNTLPEEPGVYLFLNVDKDVIYVGKAKDLKKRVKSYFKGGKKANKVEKMLQHVESIDHICLNSESEALLLECELIKKYSPRYNVLLRDDKSFPYIVLDRTHAFPKLYQYRGEQTPREGVKYFGPYSNPGLVRQTLDVLHQLFLMRQCSDHDFKTRKRPCLQYQIKRCSAPCVGFIDEVSYQGAVDKVEHYLRGGHSEIIDDFIGQMNAASAKQGYEEAKEYRDKVRLLQKMVHSGPSLTTEDAIDLLSFVQEGGVVCAYVFFFRQGICKGARYYFLSVDALDDEDTVGAFLSLFYLNQQHPLDTLPRRILLTKLPRELALIVETLTNFFNSPIKVSAKIPSEIQPWVQLAVQNSSRCLERARQVSRETEKQMSSLCTHLGMTDMHRVECFDISHTQGDETVAACVVFDKNGANRRSFRRFRIKGITPGDDYAAIHQAVHRRYKSLLEKNEALPSLIIVDGGLGQLKQAYDALSLLDIDLEPIRLMAIAKGPERRPGWETLYVHGKEAPLSLDKDSSARLLLQLIRDEAHNCAIRSHRRLRSKKALSSILEEIPGIGQSKRRQLLQTLGGLAEIREASYVELAKVPGISENLAKRIVEHLKHR